jgi:glutamate dehydrogenase
MDKIEAKGFLPPEFVESETHWFYEELGIDDMYFSTETSDAYVNIPAAHSPHNNY